MSAPLTTFTHDGLRFGVHEWGPADGRAVIALHGFPQTALSWERVAARLAPAGVRVGPAEMAVTRMPCGP
jgi:pimeloyl-ACP methyl ester carboxylesterase